MPIRPSILQINGTLVLIGMSSPPDETIDIVYKIEWREEPDERSNFSKPPKYFYINLI